ncbi:MAG: peptide chain release factor 2 [Candidatus Nomurabacteria bacterium]|jgi:peptide chain release factor 2|nr:peptide chain release factor 2 [Candidatus Nomurabacteria bacterium]
MKNLASLQEDIAAAFVALGIDEKLAELRRLEQRLAEPDVWNDSAKATELSKTAADLNNQVQAWLELKKQVDELAELAKLGDDDLTEEIAGQLEDLQLEFLELKKQLQFTGQYDNHNAILRLTAGVGGIDAMDFTEMLERMYLRWTEKAGYRAQILERSAGETAGVKTSVMEINGPFAYGKLQSENGVHRLVRLSPFNAESRETSFALVEVLPQIDAPEEVKIADKDLKIDVYRSGGHGGQSVNTTDSAVRITHLPTGITVAIQNERSQLQNREKALAILRGKLAQLRLEQRVDSIAELRAGKSAEWGAQIRNYVLHPYTLVKDTRTKHQETDTAAVFDGKIDGFIEAYLSSVMT